MSFTLYSDSLICIISGMEEFEIRFIENEGDARIISSEIFAKLYDLSTRDDKALKDSITHFLGKVNENINTKESSSASKLMSILILRDLIESSLRPQTKLNKFFNLFLSHKLLRAIEENCESIDPMKPIQDKGRNYFPGDPESGNSFVRCQLEIVKFLGNKFPKNKNGEVTNFMKVYNKLQDKGVTLPNSYQFISLGGKNHKDDPAGDSSRQRKISVNEPQYASKGGSSKEKEFEFLCNRIKIFLQTLEEEEEEEELNKQINKMHEIITKEYGKMDEGHISELLEGGNQDILSKVFEVKDFMEKEIELYNTYLNKKRNIQSYIDQIKPEGYKIFPKSSIRAGTTPMPPKPEERKIKMTNSREYETSSKFKEKEKPVRASAFDPTVVNSIGRYFEQVEERSKSPISGGFKKINDSLSKEKAVNASTMRSRVSPLNRTNLSKSINSLKGSKLAAIFTNPPNTNPPPRHYEGHQINEDFAVEDALGRINKNQGHRRFVTANFKGKGSIFENEHFQVGFKSEAIYQEISGFRVLLKIDLFFGNLCEDTLLNLKLDFKGDQNILLYANPRQIQRIVSKGEQNKIDLVVIPLKPQFPLLTMNVKYEIGGNAYECSILLPNSALKFTHFMELSKGQFLSRWSSAELYKTTEFSLSHSLPPDTMTRWIPSLTEQSSYSTFAAPGSKKDYELCTSIVMMQRYQALLKIIIRPNLHVILLLGVEEKNEDALGYYKTFMQHLQQFMKEIK